MIKILTLFALLCQDPQSVNCRAKYYRCFKEKTKLGYLNEDAVQLCFARFELRRKK